MEKTQQQQQPNFYYQLFDVELKYGIGLNPSQLTHHMGTQTIQQRNQSRPQSPNLEKNSIFLLANFTKKHKKVCNLKK